MTDVGGRPPGPGVRPAAIVLGIIFVLFVAGAVGAGLTSSPSHAPSHATRAGPMPGTGGLVPRPAADVLAAVVSPDEPPSDVLSALVVPSGTRAVPGSAEQRGGGLYDGSLGLQVPAAAGAVITFLRTELSAGRWHLISSGPSDHGAYRLIAQHPGSDGYEWEVGYTVGPTAFSSSVPGVRVPESGVTPVSIRLFAVSDQ